MSDMFLNPTKTVILKAVLAFAVSVQAQDGTIYPLDAPDEPGAIPLGTGGVENQPAPESWFRWLSMNNEGWKVAKALAEQGIATIVLKYRLQPTPASLDGIRESMDRTSDGWFPVFIHRLDLNGFLAAKKAE